MAVDYESMGRIIRKLREEKQISQEGFGSILLTSNVHISNIETGSRAPSLDLFVAIANALDVSTDDLLIDSLNHSSSDAGKEVHSLLMTCNHDEKEMLIRTLQFLKALFSEFGI